MPVVVANSAILGSTSAGLVAGGIVVESGIVDPVVAGGGFKAPPISGIVAPGILPTIERCWYEDPFGVGFDLTTDMLTQYRDGIEGRFMAPIQHLSDSVPEQDGERYRSTRSLARTLTVPLSFVGDNVTQVRGLLRNLARGVNPKKGGVGKLHLETEDGLVRYINCLYVSGFDAGGTDTGGDMTPTRLVALVFKAFDPYWYDTNPQIDPVRVTPGSTSFFPITPVILAESSIFAVLTVANDGDVEAWPIWDVTGPGTALLATNQLTGESFAVSYEIAPGVTVRVDTRPGYTSVRDSNAQKLAAQFTGDMFPLDVGTNNVVVELTDATTDSVVKLTLNERFQST